MRGKSVIKMGQNSPIWTIHDVAEYVGVSVDSVRRWYSDGYKPRKDARDFKKLPRFYVGGMWRWDAKETRTFVLTGKVS